MNAYLAALAFLPFRAILIPMAIAGVERSLLWSAIIILCVTVAILGVSVYHFKARATNVPSAEELRGRLAQVVTIWAMVAILVLGITILAIAGYNAAVSTDKDAPREFIDTAKYVFAAVVPVVAGWVGTVMAFYFGKENFRAATESVSQIAKQLTSQEKLGQTRAQDVGKAIEDVAPLRLGSNDTIATIGLDKLEEKMKTKEPPFERLPILGANGAPLMVVHRSVLNDFLLKKKTADSTKNAADYKLSDLAHDYPWLTEKSFVTIAPTASAAEAKSAMERMKGCADVFVTADGTLNSPVTRWITNVDLLQAAQV
jgi:hypothetical protein